MEWDEEEQAVSDENEKTQGTPRVAYSDLQPKSLILQELHHFVY